MGVIKLVSPAIFKTLVHMNNELDNSVGRYCILCGIWKDHKLARQWHSISESQSIADFVGYCCEDCFKGQDTTEICERFGIKAVHFDTEQAT